MVPGARARAVGRLRRFASAVTCRLTHTHEGPEILTLCAQKCATLPLPARSRLRKKRSRGFARKTSRALSAPPPGDLGGSKRQIFRQNDRSGFSRQVLWPRRRLVRPVLAAVLAPRDRDVSEAPGSAPKPCASAGRGSASLLPPGRKGRRRTRGTECVVT
jgi:hypothetical protein